MFSIQRIVVSLCLFLCSCSGVSAVIVRVDEPSPVRIVVITNGDPPTSIPFTIPLTITDDDGATALPANTPVPFAINIEYDASLIFTRVYDLYDPMTQTLEQIDTTDGDIEYTVTPVDIYDHEGVFFLTSFRMLVSLESIPASPTTIAGRSSFEVWVYNPNAYLPDFLIMTPPTVTTKSGKDVRLFLIGGGGGAFDPLLDDFPISVALSVKGPYGRNLEAGNSLMIPSAYDPGTPMEQGQYWTFPGKRSSREADCRFGEYVLESSYNQALFGISVNPTAILNPTSENLNTGGVETITVFRASAGSEDLDESVTFGVKLTKLSDSIRWFKDGRYLGKGRAKRTICKVSEAGLYRLQRSTRGKRGWCILIRVTVAACPRTLYSVPGDCLTADEIGGSFTLGCLNGGVPGTLFTLCQCPPCFRGAHCERLAPTGDPFAIAESKDFTCGELPGGNQNCKGYKFCLGGGYGCSCGCGWYGRDCDKPCSKGFYGPDCSQRCNCLASSCDRFTGACDRPKCPVGYQGFNCQIPLTISIGNPDEPRFNFPGDAP